MKRYALLVVSCLVLTQAAVAELLPESGTFKGIYHKYRTGKAGFAIFFVPENLQPQFASLDGKYIEVEVLKSGNGMMNWGRGGIIEKVGKITVLPQPPVKIHIELRPPSGGAAGTVDVFSSVENTGTEPLTLPHGPLVGGGGGIGGPVLGTYLCGDSNGGKTTLAHGQRLPLLSLGWKLAPGPGEIEVSIETPMGPAKAWINVDVDKDGKIAPLSAVTSDLRAAGQVVRQEQEEMYLKVRLSIDGDTRRAIYLAPRKISTWQTEGTVLENGESCLPGRILAFDADGKPIEITTGPYWSEGEWKLQEISAEGFEFRFRLHHNSLFEQRPIRKIALFLLTDHGLERLEIPIKEDLTMPEAMPAFGPAVDGHKLRIRMATAAFDHGQRIRWFLGGVGEKYRNDVLRIGKGQLGKGVTILIDGKPWVDDRNHGISDQILYRFPFEVTMSVVPGDRLSAGAHTVEVVLDGQDKDYLDVNGTRWPTFGKPLRSNKCTFEVK